MNQEHMEGTFLLDTSSEESDSEAKGEFKTFVYDFKFDLNLVCLRTWSGNIQVILIDIS